MYPDRRGVPVEVVFDPNWWHRNYGISFERPFYFDPPTLVENDLRMRRALYERFGLGESKPEARPIVGSMFIAGGFIVPALLGVELRFFPDRNPWPLIANLGREEILRLEPPEIESTWPMTELIRTMDALEAEFGYLAGDFNAGGILNNALDLRGQQLFVDMLEDRELVEHLFSVVGETQARVMEYVKRRTGTSSIAVNRSILNVDASIHVNGNCSVQMVSPRLYRDTLFEPESRLAHRLRPYGIHHCGCNMHLFASMYAELQPAFCDVGWGSDVARCSELLPDTFLNLRLDPKRMLNLPADEIRRDATGLLAACGRTRQVGLCAINLDARTPDANVFALLETASNTRLA